MKTDRIKPTLDVLFPKPKCPLHYTHDYELLLAVMLSAQTTDERVNEVTKTLFEYNLEELARMDLQKIEDIIKPVGMGKRKAEYIKAIANSLTEDFGGKVPHDRDYVENLKGVGHKTCNVVFAELFEEPSLAVDTHVSRVSKRLGLSENNDDVIATEKKLCAYFEREDWREVHVQLVLFGRHRCKAIKPLCDDCPFKNKECKKPRN